MIVALSQEEGLTVLFSSHHLHQVQQVCDRVGIFVNGKLLAEGDIQSLSRKLCTSSPFIIEAGVSKINSNNSDFPIDNYNEDWLKNVLKPVDGITAVTRKEIFFRLNVLRILLPILPG